MFTGDKMEILKKLNIKSNDVNLYKQALTHTSYANEHDLDSYERLEYLGDAVLELLMSEYLFKNEDIDEGEMTKMRAHYVCEKALYEYALKLNINEYILLGHGEETSGGKYRKAIVADVFEALLGAIYLDLGFEKARDYFYDKVVPLIESEDLDFITDYKSKLQELVQTDRKSLEYEVVDETGPLITKPLQLKLKLIV